MNVFAFTRIKLTVWYVIAIMAVSIMFSGLLYSGITKNIEDVFSRAQLRLRNSPGLFVEELGISKRKVFRNLLHANLLILLLSSIVSYILAHKTLAPIEEILLEQKRFIADASHELRTPLTSLKTAIEVSLRDKTLNKKTKQILHDNLKDVDALQKLIDSLLQLASQENQTIVMQLIDIHEVLSKVIKTITPLSNHRDVKIVSKIKHQQILASETGLNQLFTILLDNAIKYSNPKGTITVATIPQRRFITVKVSDTGIGIHKKYLSHIFDRFYRIDSSRTVSQSPGFGLGLSVAKQIVENHNGNICVVSELGKGSTFIVKLPV